eukprot:5733774-Pyramimonas_sp.AAC.1
MVHVVALSHTHAVYLSGQHPASQKQRPCLLTHRPVAVMSPAGTRSAGSSRESRRIWHQGARTRHENRRNFARVGESQGLFNGRRVPGDRIAESRLAAVASAVAHESEGVAHESVDVVKRWIIPAAVILTLLVSMPTVGLTALKGLCIPPLKAHNSINAVAGWVNRDLLLKLCQNFTDAIPAMGMKGYVVFFLAYALCDIFIIPVIPLAMAAGALFGAQSDLTLPITFVQTSALPNSCASYERRHQTASPNGAIARPPIAGVWNGSLLCCTAATFAAVVSFLIA